MDFDLSPAQLELQERATRAGLAIRDRAKEWDSSNAIAYQEVVDHVASTISSR